MIILKSKQAAPNKIKKDWTKLNNSCKNFIDDKEVVSEAVKQNGRALSMARVRLQNDVELFKEVAKTFNSIDLVNYYLDNSVKSNTEIAQIVVK